MAGKNDAEYLAMRRRMSRLRVKCGQKSSLEAEDVPTNENDAGFKDLIKFWKKHGIPIAKDLLSDMDEQSARTAAKRRGRRRSKELEDLHLSSSTGHLKLNHVTVTEEDELEDTESKPKSVTTKPKPVSVNPKKPFKKAQSDYVLSKSKTPVRSSNDANPSMRNKLERQSSKK